MFAVDRQSIDATIGLCNGLDRARTRFGARSRSCDLEERTSRNEDGGRRARGNICVGGATMCRFIAFAEYDPFGRRDKRILGGAGAKSRPT